MTPSSPRKTWPLLLLAALLLPLPAFPQAPGAPGAANQDIPADPGASLNLNFPEGVPLEMFIRAAELYTKKRFIFQDESVKKKTIIIYGEHSDFPMEHFFSLFQTILAMNDFTITPLPDPSSETADPIAYKILQTQKATAQPTPVLNAQEVVELPFDERWVSGIFKLKHINPTEIAPTLVNFVSNPKGIIPLPSAGVLLVNDLGLNVKRVEKILRIMDVKGPDIRMEVIKLKWAIATSIEPQLSRLVQTIMRTRVRPPQPGGQPGQETLEIVADQRTNSLIVVAEQNRIDEILKMIRKLDSGEIPAQTRGIHIYRLKNTNAAPLSDILNRVYQGIMGASYGSRYGSGYGYGYGSYGGYPGGYSPYAGAAGTSTPYGAGYSPYGYSPYGYGAGFGAGGFPGGEYPPTIVPDEQNNAIIVASDYYKFQDLSKIIEKLDVRRPQVLLEVAFVEVSGDDTLDLGIELATIGRPGDSARGFAATNFSMSRLVDTDADLIPDARLPIVNPGVIAGVFKDRVGNIPALLYALERQGKINVLQVPSTVTSDNQIAELTVGDERPTATFTQTQSGNDSRTFRGFEKAGVTVKITPHISEERYLRLETEVSVADFAGQTADPVLPPAKTTRELKVAVSVPNEHTIVVGGLTKSADRDDVSGVPLLMDIPGIGAAFRHSINTRERRTLYVFITPHIFSDEDFLDYKRASESRRKTIQDLTGHQVGVAPREQGVPQYLPPFELQPPFAAPDKK
jgi:general secretion pathway protein D